MWNLSEKNRKPSEAEVKSGLFEIQVTQKATEGRRHI